MRKSLLFFEESKYACGMIRYIMQDEQAHITHSNVKIHKIHVYTHNTRRKLFRKNYSNLQEFNVRMIFWEFFPVLPEKSGKKRLLIQAFHPYNSPLCTLEWPVTDCALCIIMYLLSKFSKITYYLEFLLRIITCVYYAVCALSSKKYDNWK